MARINVTTDVTLAVLFSNCVLVHYATSSPWVTVRYICIKMNNKNTNDLLNMTQQTNIKHKPRNGLKSDLMHAKRSLTVDIHVKY